VVTQATAKVGLAEKYNQVAGKASELGLVKKKIRISKNMSREKRWTGCSL